MKANKGDWLVIEPVHVGEHRRRALVLDVRGPDGEPPYLVRWADTEREALVFPRAGTRVVDSEHVVRFIPGS